MVDIAPIDGDRGMIDDIVLTTSTRRNDHDPKFSYALPEKRYPGTPKISWFIHVYFHLPDKELPTKIAYIYIYIYGVLGLKLPLIFRDSQK